MAHTQVLTREASRERLEKFKGRFRCNPDLAGHIGSEAEFFATRGGVVAPVADVVLSGTKPPLTGMLTHELSLCQLERRTRPSADVVELLEYFQVQETLLERLQQTVLERHGFRFGQLYVPVGPKNMSTKHFQTERYDGIVASMSEEQLLAACRIIGLHFHVGVEDLDEMLEVHNGLCNHIDELYELGDFSGGKRQRLYEVVTGKSSAPVPLEDWEHFCTLAVDNGFWDDPTKNWWGVRPHPLGTVEVRVFDIPSNENGSKLNLEVVGDLGFHVFTLGRKYMRRG